MSEVLFFADKFLRVAVVAGGVIAAGLCLVLVLRFSGDAGAWVLKHWRARK